MLGGSCLPLVFSASDFDYISAMRSARWLVKEGREAETRDVLMI